jgi:hypothetical protein
MNVLVEMNSPIYWKRRMRAGVTALMNMLVLVGDKTITYNDMLGVSRESADCESNESARAPVQPLKQSPAVASWLVFGARTVKRGRRDRRTSIKPQLSAEAEYCDKIKRNLFCLTQIVV